MLVTKTWCLPDIGEGTLQELHKKLVAAAVSIKSLGIKSEEDMINLFPADMMSYGLGSEILMEVSIPKLRNQVSLALFSELTEEFAVILRLMFPTARIHVGLIFNDEIHSVNFEPKNR